MRKILGLAVVLAVSFAAYTVFAQANVQVRTTEGANKVVEKVTATEKTASETDKVKVRAEEKVTATGKIKEEIKVQAKAVLDPEKECLGKPEFKGKDKNDPAVKKCVADTKAKASADAKAVAEKVNEALKTPATAKAPTAATTTATAKDTAKAAVENKGTEAAKAVEQKTK